MTAAGASHSEASREHTDWLDDDESADAGTPALARIRERLGLGYATVSYSGEWAGLEVPGPTCVVIDAERRVRLLLGWSERIGPVAPTVARLLR